MTEIEKKKVRPSTRKGLPVSQLAAKKEVLRGLKGTSVQKKDDAFKYKGKKNKE